MSEQFEAGGDGKAVSEVVKEYLLDGGMAVNTC